MFSLETLKTLCWFQPKELGLLSLNQSLTVLGFLNILFSQSHVYLNQLSQRKLLESTAPIDSFTVYLKHKLYNVIVHFKTVRELVQYLKELLIKVLFFLGILLSITYCYFCLRGNVYILHCTFTYI